MYECDEIVTSYWECGIENNEFFVPFDGKLLNVIDVCKKDFRAGLSIPELCDMLQISAKQTCIALNDIFKGRKKSVNR